jgi:sarcosine oxidase, subunit beta
MMEEAVTKAVHRVPVIERARIAGGWAGLRPLTPDDHAIRGHGFQHSPATGRVAAEWIVDGRPSMDLSLFDPARFDGRTPSLPGEAPEPGRPDAE